MLPEIASWRRLCQNWTSAGNTFILPSHKALGVYVGIIMGGDVAGCSDNGVIGSGKGVELAFITA